MERKLKFPRKEGNYVIVLEKVKNGMSIQKFNQNGDDVTEYPNMCNLDEVLDVLKNTYRVERD